MTQIYINDAMNLLEMCRCDDCGHQCFGDELDMISDIEQRLTPGGVVPAGQCPKCGSLSYVNENPTMANASSSVEAALLESGTNCERPFGFVLILEGDPIAHSEHVIRYDDSDLDHLELRHFDALSVYQKYLKKNQNDPEIYTWIIENSGIYLD